MTDKISSLVLVRPYNWRWFLGMGIGFVLTMVLFAGDHRAALAGASGIWGIDVPVMWGFAIVNFVWWIGIGHAGTLISAILLLLKQDWRTSINRFAEAMTLSPSPAPGCSRCSTWAGRGSSTGCCPIPTRWGSGRSGAARWSGTCSPSRRMPPSRCLFWYVGLIPDLATLRDRAKNRWAQYIYGFLAMGWRGSARHWHRYRTAYLLLAGLATPLVVSVHTVVAFDFTVAIVPGWHSTIFPPYFVAGAIFSGFAMVMTLGDSLAVGFRPAGFHHDPPPGQHGQGHAGHGPDRRLRLRDGSLHGLVRPQSVREVRPAREPAHSARTPIPTG